MWLKMSSFHILLHLLLSNHFTKQCGRRLKINEIHIAEHYLRGH
jgi:hypothetical protein